MPGPPDARPALGLGEEVLLPLADDHGVDVVPVAEGIEELVREALDAENGLEVFEGASPSAIGDLVTALGEGVVEGLGALAQPGLVGLVFWRLGLRLALER